MSAKSLALISGKGGSGKTTIGICMATMLADCGLKVLLVDCDLSTNGATYFYESQLNSADEEVISFTDLLSYCVNSIHNDNGPNLQGIGNVDIQFLKVDKGVFFIPSIIPSDIGTEHIEFIISKAYVKAFALMYNQYIEDQFDIVIFDCQAGYSSALDLILPISDSALLVMEADAISSAAARNLHIRIAGSVKKTKMYQVFSKVTEEEREIYGQVKLGTFYTTVDAILFDSNVRNAFAFAEIPNLMNTKSEFGIQVYSICKRVFPSLNMEKILRKYKAIFEYNRILGQIEKCKPSKAFKVGLSVIVLTMIFIMVLISIYSLKPNDIVYDEKMMVLAATVLISFVGCNIAFLVGTGDFKRIKEYGEKRRDLEVLVIKYPELLDLVSDEELGSGFVISIMRWGKIVSAIKKAYKNK